MSLADEARMMETAKHMLMPSNVEPAPGTRVVSVMPDHVPGYEKLDDVLQRAYRQSARGKGALRHAREAEPFTDQVILQGAARFGVGALLFQAFKKSEESQRLKTGPAVAELLGAIVYLSAAVIERERLNALNPDNT